MDKKVPLEDMDKKIPEDIEKKVILSNDPEWLKKIARLGDDGESCSVGGLYAKHLEDKNKDLKMEDNIEEKVKDCALNVKKEIENILKTITIELQSIAKKHGAWIVIGLVIIYLWKKIK